jgi:ATP-dependent DNA helicase RecG
MIPKNDEILALLDRLDEMPADALEGIHLDFKPWNDPKSCMKLAVEYAVCFANADGGVIVFGVADFVRGRTAAIHGAKGYDLDVWRRGLFDSTRPNLAVAVEELAVPEGTGKLLVVRVPKGETPPYGTADGLYKKRVGKNCMPLDPAAVARVRIATGAVDWSGEPAADATIADLDPVEVARARSILRSKSPESELLRLNDVGFLRGLEAIRGDRVTHTGLLLFGHSDVLSERCPQAQVHYVHQPSETKVARNDVWRAGLLQVVTKVEEIFSGPVNPEEELSVGLFKLRIPAFPLDVVREAVLNAVTHRDYSDPGEVLIRHAPRELALTSPGGFVGGIRVDNILRHEPVARNRTLANAFLKLRLVEAAGTGRRRIFVPMLSYGKRMPQYESDGQRVTLRIYDGVFDQALAQMVAKWNAEGRDIQLDTLLVLAYMKEHPYIDAKRASGLLQLEREDARGVLDHLSIPGKGILERRGRTQAATFHLAKGIAKDLLGRAAYTRTKGIAPARFAEIVREYVRDHGSIANRECRELLGLGDSASAQVEASRYLKKWSASAGFLKPEGTPPRVRYRLRTNLFGDVLSKLRGQ